MAAIDEAAAAFGLVVEMPAEPAPELWAEHLPALRLFEAMGTQWRAGYGGRTGLEYAALPLVEQRLRMSRRAARAAFPHLQAMEVAALEFWAEQRDRAR